MIRSVIKAIAYLIFQLFTPELTKSIGLSITNGTSSSNFYMSLLDYGFFIPGISTSHSSLSLKLFRYYVLIGFIENLENVGWILDDTPILFGNSLSLTAGENK